MLREFLTGEKQFLIKLGKRVKLFRMSKGMSQKQLGDYSELSKVQIGRIERAEYNTSILTLLRICKTLDIELSELFDFSEDPKG